MKVKFFLTAIVLLMVGAYSCNKFKDANCKTCKTLPPATTSRVNINTSDLELDIYYGESKDKKDPDYIMGIAKKNHSSSEMAAIIKGLGLLHGNELSGANTLKGISVYLKGDVKNYTKITKENVLGYVLFYEKLEYIWVSCYEVGANSNFLRIEELSIPTGLISSQDIYSFKHILSRNVKGPISAVVLIDYKIAPKKTMMLRNFRKVVLEVAESKFNYKLRLPNQTGHCDNTPCSPSFWGDACIPQERENGQAGWTCWGNPIDCFAETVQDYLEQLEMEYNVNHDVLHQIREDFCFLSTKGVDYAYDYYYVSGLVTPTMLSLSDAENTMSILNDEIVPICVKMLTYPNSATVIAYDSTSKNNMLNYIDSVRHISTDTRYQQILDRIEGDLELYESKSIQFITEDFDEWEE